VLSEKDELQLIKEQEHALRQLKYDHDEEMVRRKYEQHLRERIQDEVNLKNMHAASPMYGNMPAATSFKINGSGEYFTGTGNNREHGTVVSNITTGHGDGYFSHIQIYQDDFVRYKLLRGFFFSKSWFKLTGRPPKDEDGVVVGWQNIPGQYDADLKLEVTLGKTYLKIDEEVAEDVAECEHEEFIRGIAKTDPENLKMIAGLKTLDDGMKAPLEAPYLTGPVTISSKTHSSISTVHASQSMMAVDNCDNISFSDKMQEAIKKVSEEPRPGPSGVGKSP
jgi:hypothetical protein